MVTYGGLEVDEAEGANHYDYESNENICDWPLGSPFSKMIEGFGKTTH